MNSKATETPRIVLEAEKIVYDLWVKIDKYERWLQKAVAETMARRQRDRQEAAEAL